MNKKQFLWNTIGTSINSVMSFLYNVAITRINGIDTWGVFSLCLSFTFILYTFECLGTRVFQVSDIKRNAHPYIKLKLFAGTVALAAGIGYALINGYPAEKFAVVVILIFVRFFEALSESMYSSFQKDERLDLVGISYTLKNGVAFAAFIAVDILTGNIVLATAVMLASTIMVFLLFDLRIFNRFYEGFKPKASGRELLQLTKATGYFWLFNMAIILLTTLPRLVADNRCTDAEMGIFATIMMIPTVMLLLGQIVSQPYVNSLTIAYHEKRYRDFTKTVIGVIAVLAGLAVICSLGAYFLGPFVLGKILGVDLSGTAWIMVAAISAGMFNVFVTFISTLLTIMRRTSQQLAIYIGVLVIEAAMLFATPSMRVNGIMIIYLVSMAVEFAAFLVYYLIAYKKETA